MKLKVIDSKVHYRMRAGKDWVEGTMPQDKAEIIFRAGDERYLFDMVPEKKPQKAEKPDEAE